MLLDNSIETDFIADISQKIKLEKDGNNRYRVISPFHFNDGDQLFIILKKEFGRWILSDERHTFRHITYGMDSNIIFEGNKNDVIKNAITMFDIDYHNGELKLEVFEMDLAGAFYNFVQCILKIIDVSYLFRYRYKSTFLDNFKNFMSQEELVSIRELDWYYDKMDASRSYKVDCKISIIDKTPILVYAINTDSKLKDATIALHKFNTWNYEYRPLGIFERDKKLGRNALNQFNDVCQDSFIGIDENYNNILNYIMMQNEYAFYRDI